MTIELSEYVINAIADAVVKKMQKPYEDCISRKDAIACCRNEWEEEVADRIEALPPVTPQPKTGRWIAQDIHNCHTNFKCSKCDYIHSFMHLYGEPTADYTYCPNCGAKMESEDKE